ncbi:MAG TPA: AAA family ATPase [Longimicrobiaceae bacterium]|nr:AAA family ATPase [Longimicrobiaceae bacterium]
MRILHLKLENWKNFRSVDLPLQRRVFIVGPNASGKSNLLDALRFLRDIADPEGGFQRAVKSRGGVSQLRCLHARQQPNIAVEVSILLEDLTWSYRLEFAQDNQRRPQVRREEVTRDGHVILRRPDKADDVDSNRLTQTHLEQVNANKDFRGIAEFLSQLRYLHVVPQLIRESDRMLPRSQDPYGSDFLEQIAKTPNRTLSSRLKRINQALQVAVPQLRELKLERDDRGVPHLKWLHEHWRPHAGWQTEEHFSDGTLRLLGLLWAFLDGNAPLLLEEPELSLHSAVVRHIPSMMIRAGRKSSRQILVSTHSADLLSDESIGPEEVVLLEPSSEGTRAVVAAEIEQVRELIEGGLTVADAVLPQTAPREAAQLALFGE